MAFPREFHAVAVGKRVADFVVGDRLPVVAGQKVFPVFVFIGVAAAARLRTQLSGRVIVGFPAGDVAAGVVGVHGADAGFLVVRADKLVLLGRKKVSTAHEEK